jgi:hypothetical protein
MEAQEIVLERSEHFVKQSYRNRCRILTTAGVQSLVMPITSRHGKVKITDVRLDYTQKWLNNHWRTIQSAYGKAPYFEYYADDLHAVLFRKIIFLYDLNYMLLSMCLDWLKVKVPVRETLIYEKSASGNVFDLRSVLNPKKPDQCYQFYYPQVYNQVFGNTFVDNLSIVDLIFCEGPHAAAILRASSFRK